MKVAVIFPAAGLGTRMGRVSDADKAGAARKQFLLLDGQPIIVHTLRKFVACEAVSEIIVALRQEDIEWARELLTPVAGDKPLKLVVGGATRQESVENALVAVSADVELVAVHDAVRPFVDAETIQRVVAEAAECGAAIVGVVPVDTVKQVHRNKIRATIPRDKLILTQTPQVFRVGLLREAYQQARKDEFIGTDESSLVERLEQVEVSVVAGNDRNIKITRPGDMDLARLIMAEEAAKRNAQ